MTATGQSPATDYIEFPPAPGFWKTTGLPPIRVELPLQSKMRAGPGVFLFNLFGLVLGCAFILTGLADFAAFSSTGLALYGVLITLLGVLLWSFTFSYFVDLMRSGPHLTIDTEGIRDRRTIRTCLRWSEIVEADLRTSTHLWMGSVALLLTAKVPIDKRSAAIWLWPANIFRWTPERHPDIAAWLWQQYPSRRGGARHGGASRRQNPRRKCREI